MKRSHEGLAKLASAGIPIGIAFEQVLREKESDAP